MSAAGTIALPAFAPVEHPALSALASPGIALVAPAELAADSPFVVLGKFVMPEEDHGARSGTPHRDLVLTVLRRPMYASLHPFRDCVFFADDVQRAGDLRVGWFGLDVWTYCGFRAAGTYFVRMSLGETLSRSVTTVVK